RSASTDADNRSFALTRTCYNYATIVVTSRHATHYSASARTRPTRGQAGNPYIPLPGWPSMARRPVAPEPHGERRHIRPWQNGPGRPPIRPGTGCAGTRFRWSGAYTATLFGAVSAQVRILPGAPADG